MKTAPQEISGAEPRPSKLIAEALVLRHNRDEVKARAEAMGMAESLTQTVIRVCCGNRRDTECHEYSTAP